jgi:recombination protein RecR
MLKNSPLLQNLITQLCILPGVGPKTAQKMALNLLERNRDGAQQLSTALKEALSGIGHCKVCHSLSELDICDICSSTHRDNQILCVVESPLDIYQFEQAGFNGKYFVLKGSLSPLDGIGPKEIGIDLLFDYIKELAPNEVIMANHSTVEGESTVYYLASLLEDTDIKVTRIAHGVPFGAEFDKVDGTTLAYALSSRIKL